VALLNNLGGTTPLEMSVLAEELARSRIGDRIRWIVGPAPLMTSLDMHGFSLSLLPLCRRRRRRCGPRRAPGLAGAGRLGAVAVLPLPDGLDADPADPSPTPRPAR
jgi:hypothetical protein